MVFAPNVEKNYAISIATHKAGVAIAVISVAGLCGLVTMWTKENKLIWQ